MQKPFVEVAGLYGEDDSMNDYLIDTVDFGWNLFLVYTTDCLKIHFTLVRILFDWIMLNQYT